MTEVEAYNSLLSTSDYALNLGEQSITLLTGYLLIAFFIGKRLTMFQVSFVNIVFALMFLSTQISLATNMDTLVYFTQLLTDMGSEIPTRGIQADDWLATPLFALAISAMLFGGALYFMWTIRNQSDE
jgi:hypothetical protein